MKRLRREFQWIVDNPLYAIIGVLAVIMLVFGVYLGSPWYVPGPDATAGNIFESRWSQFIVSLAYCTPSAIAIYGLIRKSRRAITSAAFWLFFIYLFATILRISVIGWVPFTWLFILCGGLIAGVIRLSLEVRKI